MPDSPSEGEVIKVSTSINYTGLPHLCLAPVEFLAFKHTNRIMNRTSIGVSYIATSPGISEVSIDWDTTGFEGNYTIGAIVDPDNYIPETNETNNVATGNITILPAKGPRIKISSPKNGTYYNSTIRLNYTVTGYNISLTGYKIDDEKIKHLFVLYPFLHTHTPKFGIVIII